MAAGFGAFGKMPALGDFFRLGLMPDFIAHWDAWLQAGMIEAHKTLEGRWNDCYLSAPIWRFTLSAGLAGSDAVEGVLMPSVDRVGRQFPLTLARALPKGADPAASHLAAQDRFAKLEELALSALDEKVTPALLQGRLSPFDLPDAMPGPYGRIGAAALWLRASEPAAALAAMLVGQSFPNAAIFSALLPDGQGLILTEGLPQPARFSQFIDPAGQLK